jgi:hypothetical protein
MSQSFHPLQQTQVICVRIKNHILSLEQSPSIQPILQQKPEEHLLLHLAAEPPYPLKGRVHIFVPNEMIICFAYRIGDISLDVRPLILLIIPWQALKHYI